MTQSAREVVIDGVVYKPVTHRIVDTPDMPGHDKWIPAVGQTVWSNFDSGLPPMGVCIGYLDDPGHPRHGQPILEWQGEDQVGFLGRKKGARFLCHPMFMWPFAPGSPEHEQAIAEGRFADA